MTITETQRAEAEGTPESICSNALLHQGCPVLSVQAAFEALQGERLQRHVLAVGMSCPTDCLGRGCCI